MDPPSEIVRAFSLRRSDSEKTPQESFNTSKARTLQLQVEDLEVGDTREYDFDEFFVIIGRSPECDLVLEDDFISSRHAYLQQIHGGVICVDLASSNGTYWPEGNRPYGWFDDQHPIRIGRFQLRLLSQESAERLEDPVYDPAAFFRSASSQEFQLPQVSLQQVTGDSVGDSWILSRPITLVGSSSRCKLRLSHESVSRVHCSMILRPDGLWIIDLLGTEGTLVNDRGIRSARIQSGDLLTVGAYTFRIKYSETKRESSTTDLLPARENPSSDMVNRKFAGDVLAQIAQMQEQFLSHSQKQTEMMLQFFQTLHSQQHEVIATELSRVNEINRELGELKLLLQQSASSNSPDVSQDRKKQSETPAPPTDEVHEDVELRHESPTNAAEPVDAETERPAGDGNQNDGVAIDVGNNERPDAPESLMVAEADPGLADEQGTEFLDPEQRIDEPESTPHPNELEEQLEIHEEPSSCPEESLETSNWGDFRSEQISSEDQDTAERLRHEGPTAASEPNDSELEQAADEEKQSDVFAVASEDSRPVPESVADEDVEQPGEGEENSEFLGLEQRIDEPGSTPHSSHLDEQTGIDEESPSALGETPSETSDWNAVTLEQSQPEDHHKWLLERMHHLEREKESLLGKIMRSVFHT